MPTLIVRPSPATTAPAACLPAPAPAGQGVGTSQRLLPFSRSSFAKSFFSRRAAKVAMAMSTAIAISTHGAYAMAMSNSALSCSIGDIEGLKWRVLLLIAYGGAAHLALVVLALQIDRIIWALLERRS